MSNQTKIPEQITPEALVKEETYTKEDRLRDMILTELAPILSAEAYRVKHPNGSK